MYKWTFILFGVIWSHLVDHLGEIFNSEGEGWALLDMGLVNETLVIKLSFEYNWYLLGYPTKFSKGLFVLVDSEQIIDNEV